MSTKLRLVVLVLWCCALISAQITFSRDWSGGKRSPPPHSAVDCTHFSRLCMHFVNELKHTMSKQLHRPHNHLPDAADETQTYDEEN